MQESEKYGTYYGELVNFKDNQELYYAYWDREGETKEQIDKLYEAGVKEVLLDVENGEDGSSTMFFETDENTDFKSLMVVVAGMSPHEFTEETEHHFRMWFD